MIDDVLVLPNTFFFDDDDTFFSYYYFIPTDLLITILRGYTKQLITIFYLFTIIIIIDKMIVFIDDRYNISYSSYILIICMYVVVWIQQ